MRSVNPLFLVAFTAFLGGIPLACGESESQPKPEAIEELPIAEEIGLSGLDATVDVVIDRRGVPHIYAADPMDAIRVQGYLMASDRLAQMDFLRRVVTGKLAELFGSFSPTVLENDKYMRVMGFTRQARAILDTLSESDPTYRVLQAYAEGVNAFIARVRSGEARLPGILQGMLLADRMEDWTILDTLAIVRYQSWSLSFTADQEIALTEAAVGVADAFPADASDPRLAARAHVLQDFWSFSPAEEVFTRPEFYKHDRQRAPFIHGGLSPTSHAFQLPARNLLKEARSFFASQRFGFTRHADSDWGSNNWVVHGSHTASGAPLLANDPHLALSSPPLFWMSHLNTKRAGGDWDVEGITIAGTPAVTLGYNRDVAWGCTVTNFDVTDIYEESIVPGQGEEPDAVLFNEQPVVIEKVHEVIPLKPGPAYEFDVEMVPHHGPIIPETRTENAALSFRWVGEQVSDELSAFLGLATATDMDAALNALSHFEVGSQNFVLASSAGEIAWSTHAHVPTRDPRALTFDPASETGFCPAMVLPGTGEYEWTGRVADDALPQDRNPAQGFIATANQDPVGLTRDGNPFNDQQYIGWGFNLGHRMSRIVEMLQGLSAKGGITNEDMSIMQADHLSPLGRKLGDAFVSALDKAAEEGESAGSHPDLSALVSQMDAARRDRLARARAALQDWSHLTPAGVEEPLTQAEIKDSLAATIFNVSLPRLIDLAFGDELERIGTRPDSQHVAKVLEWAILDSERLRTYDSGLGDTVLWDDLDTTDVVETRDERIVRAIDAGLAFLVDQFGPDMNTWRWGNLHTVRFESLIPVGGLGPTADVYSIPTPTDPEFPNGYPRHGDNFVVDASHPGLWDPDHFSYDHGPVQRLVVEMTTEGPRAFNALPGGQQDDPEQPHHADEAQLWRHNQAAPMFFDEKDVVQHAEQRIRLVP